MQLGASYLRICRRTRAIAKRIPQTQPILIMTMTSDVVPKPQIYDVADSILAQKMSQIQGVGQVFVGGSSSPAVRVELNPLLLANTGIGLEAVRTALAGRQCKSSQGRLSGRAEPLGNLRQRSDFQGRVIMRRSSLDTTRRRERRSVLKT